MRIDYRILQRHRGFSATAEITQYADFDGRDVKHGDSRKSRHTTGKSHDDRIYVIILQR